MKAEQPFVGFTPQTFQFLSDLKENNFKEWFEDHRQLYEIELLQPFRALVNRLSPALHNIDSEFELKRTRVLSRIYRDIRFSKNKDPYKSAMWMIFQRRSASRENYPGYYMEINPEQCTYGMGYYAPKRNVMDSLRDIIETEPDKFRKLIEEDVIERGFIVEGEMYKRAIPNNLPDYFQEFINRKSLYVTKTIPLSDKRLYSDKLAQLLTDDFTQLADLYHLMIEAKEMTE